ncbi:MAG: hypothetical protein Q9228_002049 [Teloschistes exilis]
MHSLFPTKGTLQYTFASQSSFACRNSNSPSDSKPAESSQKRLFSTWSAIDDVKSKASSLSGEAQKEISKASAAAQAKTGQIELYSAEYYAACTFGGLAACGLTHTAVTPLDLVKCRRQVDSKLYKGNFEAWGRIGRAEGLRGIFTGWAPTFFGYSAQGAFKYGGYEFFKKFYSDLAGQDAAYRYKTTLYLATSASAELIADVALCPFEAVKVRMQTTIPPFASSTFGGISTITGKEGIAGLYKGLYPLWGRQIPYTMMKFASFETIVEAIYGYMPRNKSDYGKGVQTGISFAGGYLAGILCAAVSHPADVMVSKLNANRQPGEAFGAAMGRIYKDIGFGGLWNGLVLRIFMIGTLTSLQWGIYDSFKVFMGIRTTISQWIGISLTSARFSDYGWSSAPAQADSELVIWKRNETSRIMLRCFHDPALVTLNFCVHESRAIISHPPDFVHLKSESKEERNMTASQPTIATFPIETPKTGRTTAALAVPPHVGAQGMLIGTF